MPDERVSDKLGTGLQKGVENLLHKKFGIGIVTVLMLKDMQAPPYTLVIVAVAVLMAQLAVEWKAGA